MSGARFCSVVFWVLAGAWALGLVVVALVPTGTIAAFLQHEGLTRDNGGAIIATTLEGAALVRVAAPVAGLALLLVPLLIRRVLANRVSEGLPAGSAVPGGSVAILCGLVVLAIVVRLPRLGESLWFDELAILQKFIVFGPGAIVGNYYDPGNHILHSLLTWASITAAGSVNELTLRFPAFLASILAVPAFYLVGRRAFVAEGGALIAAGLAAVMPICVLEGVEARGYSLIITLAALATASFLGAVSQPSTTRFVVTSVLIAVAVYTHPVAFVLGPGFVLAVLVTPELRRAGSIVAAMVLSCVLAGILAMALYAPVVPDMLALRTSLAVDGAAPRRLLSSEGLHTIYQMSGAWHAVAAILVLPLVVLGFVCGMRQRPMRLALAATGLPVVLAIAFFAIAGTWMYARFLLFGVPFTALAIASALCVLHRRHSFAGIAAGAAVLGVYGYDLVTRPAKQPLLDAIEIVARQHRANDAVAIIGLQPNVLLPYTLDRRWRAMTLDFNHFDEASLTLLEQHAPRWIIAYYEKSFPADALRYIRTHYTIERELAGWVDWDNGDVTIWLRKPGPLHPPLFTPIP